MSSMERILSAPLEVFDALRAEHVTMNPQVDPDMAVMANMATSVQQLLDSGSVPLLTPASRPYLEDGQLVRVRAMVTDMLAQELYVKQFKGSDNSIHSGALRDVTNIEHAKGIMHEPSTILGDRRLLMAVAVPGLSAHVQDEWARGEREQQQDDHLVAKAKNQVAPKRSREMMDEDDADEEMHKVQRKISVNTSEVKQPLSLTDSLVTPQKKQRDTSLWSLRSEQPVVIKIYSDDDSLKISDVCEFIGIYSRDSDTMLDTVGVHTTEFAQKEVIPTSVAPRLHCLTARKIDVVEDLGALEVNDFAQARETLLEFIATVLASGSEITETHKNQAICILLHLISRVHTRVKAPEMALGVFGLNILCPTEEQANDIRELYNLLAPAVRHMEMSIANLNQQPWAPYKDYERDRVVSGPLHVAAGTCVMLDEMMLQPGQLTEVGVKNVTVTSKMLSAQQLDFDFNYHSLPFPTDVLGLIISPLEGKSILPHDIRMVLGKTTQSSVFESVLATVEPRMLHGWRQYLATARSFPFTLTEQVTEMLATAFLDDKKYFQPTEFQAREKFFHLTLSLARLYASSGAAQGLTSDIFNNVREWMHAMKVGQ